MSEETAGKKIYDHLIKTWDETDDCTMQDMVDERAKNYNHNLIECALTHKKLFDHDFYIDVQAKWEKIFKKKVHRFFFIGRKTCPTPTYDQTVYKVHRNSDALEFLWALPDEVTSTALMEDPLSYLPEYRDIINFVSDMRDGKLLELAKRLNGETKECPIIIKD